MWKGGGDPEAIVNTQGLAQISDEGAIAAAVDEVIAASPKIVEDYKRGNSRALGALVGPVMKKLNGKANAAVVNRILADRIA
jgi:aspartyl-tRNA(Asn)/glutamyl-tRNA(Gln) amidotransferase subunit B